MSKYILAVDQGTSSSKAILLDTSSEIVASSENVPATSCCPRPGWVECQPEEMFSSVVQACRSVVNKVGISPRDIACVGLANQGETIIAFDRDGGTPVYPAISWQAGAALNLSISNKVSTPYTTGCGVLAIWV